ncbi:MAG: hypothetical protein ACP5RD_03330 [bacterium]|jgi:hypothetical protein
MFINSSRAFNSSSISLFRFSNSSSLYTLLLFIISSIIFKYSSILEFIFSKLFFISIVNLSSSSISSLYTSISFKDSSNSLRFSFIIFFIFIKNSFRSSNLKLFFFISICFKIFCISLILIHLP